MFLNTTYTQSDDRNNTHWLHIYDGGSRMPQYFISVISAIRVSLQCSQKARGAAFLQSSCLLSSVIFHLGPLLFHPGTVSHNS